MKKRRIQPVSAIELREPQAEDSFAVNRLISGCPPLDENSIYCNLLQCTHFAKTACVAEREGRIAGFISGYLSPERSHTLFIWQVAIVEAVRGRGLAKKMLQEILARPVCQNVNFLETTITKDNISSWALFHGFADNINAPCQESEYFTRKEHFADQHDDEYLLTIGPFYTHPQQQDSVHPYISRQ